MISYYYFYSVVVLLALSCVSCGDNPELVEKREKQKAEIVRLTGELTLIDEKLNNMPPDVTAELVEAKLLAVKQSAEVADLEIEIERLTARKISLLAEFEAYKAKYQIK